MKMQKIRPGNVEPAPATVMATPVLPGRGPCEGGGPFFHHLFPSSSHSITEPEMSAAHRARYFSNAHEGACQEETRTVRAIFRKA